MSELVITRVSDGVGVVTMNRPEAGNGLNADLLRALFEALHEFNRDDAVRAIVVAANGKVWSGGGDLAALSASFGETDGNGLFYAMGDTGVPTLTAHDQMFDDIGPGRWVLAVREIEKPLIAAVDGAVAGGALGLFGLHDYRIGGSAASFTPVFVRLGVGPDFGASWFLPRIMGLTAATGFLLGNERYSAQRALETGLLHEVVEGDVVERAIEFGSRLAALPPLGVRANVRALRRSLENTLREQLALEWRNQDVVFASEDAREALAAFRAKGASRNEGAKA